MIDDQRTEWTRRARCRGLDPEHFFVRSLQQAKSAIQVCQRCPVRQDCLDYAVEEGIEVGVWGAVTGISGIEIMVTLPVVGHAVAIGI